VHISNTVSFQTFKLLAGSELIVNFYNQNTTEDEQNLACMEYFFGEQFDKELLLASPYSEDFFTNDDTSDLPKNRITTTHQLQLQVILPTSHATTWKVSVMSKRALVND